MTKIVDTYPESAIGKELFLTEEEAEKALVDEIMRDSLDLGTPEEYTIEEAYEMYRQVADEYSEELREEDRP